MGYTPTTPTRADTELVLLSDDKEYGTLRVPLKAQYNGTPALVFSDNTRVAGAIGLDEIEKRLTASAAGPAKP